MAYDPQTMKAQRIAGFRSKNEFAWALAFDGAKLEYLYEPKLFKLSNGEYYLPDFFFPKTGCWAEIKTKANDSEIEKARLLSLVSDVKQVVILEKYPSFRRDFKAFIKGEPLKTKFLITQGQILDNRGILTEWNIFNEKRLINNEFKKIGSEVSNAKHFATGEFTQERVENTQAWKMTVNHLKEQGWHDYLGGDTKDDKDTSEKQTSTV